MGGEIKRQLCSIAGFGVQRFYEELPLGPKIMVSYPARVWCPATDVFECDKAYVIKCALSGLQRNPDGGLEDAEVFVERDTIVIRGERKDHCPRHRCRFFQMEIYFGPFECRVHIGAPFDRTGIRAEYQEGFLEVIVPKAAPDKKSRQVKVKP